MARSVRTILATVTVGALAAGGLVLSSPHAVAAASPESLSILTTKPLAVTSSSGKDLALTLNVVRHANNASKPDTHSKGQLTVTLTKAGATESHSWTFNLAKDSFANNAKGAGQLKTGTQIAPYGSVDLSMSRLKKGVKQNCDGGDFQVNTKVALKGSLLLKTKSSGANPWGKVALSSATLKGTLSGGHGPDTEEACGGFPTCVHGISWQASEDVDQNTSVTLSGQIVAPAGKTPVGTIDGNRFVNLPKPSGAFRIDDVTATAGAQTLAPNGKKEVLSILADPSQPAAGDAALTSKSKSPYGNGCSGAQEKGSLWSAKYVTADQPLTFAEDIFGPISIASTKTASFEKFKIA